MQRKFKITVNGKEYDVAVEEVTAGNTLMPQPGDMRIPEPAAPATPAPAPTAKQSDDPADLCSPLAGMVESLPVGLGQQVETGEPVAVIEAMKMKTSVVAHRAGKVTVVSVKVEDAVEAGHVLMRIE